MTITSLPHDIFPYILAYLDRRDTLSVSLTCSILSHVVQENLLRNVVLEGSDHTDILKRFAQSMEENATLKRRVRTFAFSLNHYMFTFPDSIPELPRVTSEMPNLNYVSLDIRPAITPQTYQHMQPFIKMRSLSCRLPGTETQEGYMQEELSPLGLASTLNACKTTLTRLKLDGRAQCWRTHDGSRLDLSFFEVLTVLDVPCYLLFKSYDPGPSRDGVYLLLPPSLESLQVFFDWGMGLVYNSYQERHDFEHGNIPESCYNWLTELCVHKATHLPRLNNVGVKENLKWRRGSPFPGIIWCPQCLVELFEENKVKLEIVMREHYSGYLVRGAAQEPHKRPVRQTIRRSIQRG